MFTMRLSKRSLGLLASAAALVLLAACPDPDGRFDEFVERSPTMGATGGTGGQTGRVADLTGRFFLSLATNLNFTKPLFFEATVAMTLGPNDTCPPGACTIDLEIQPLSNAGNPRKKVDKCADAFEPVGDLIVLKGVEVDENGSFRAEFKDATVPGCANPISGGDIVAPSLVLVATTRSADLSCGMVEGRATHPTSVDLKNSTFAAERLAQGESPADVTAPISACPAASGTGGAGG
ncbi:MAG TPA: hypothetical protein VGD74_04675, partial [Vulgatibacter sp.]